MSLSSLGGVLVDTPSDISVQSLLATHSNLLSQTAFLPSPTTEITLDEDDVFQCGRCKKVFTSFHQFMLHKQDHQIASSSSRILNDRLALNISRDLNRTLNNTASTEHEAEACLSSTHLLKDSSCEEFDLPESLRGSEQSNTNNVLNYNSIGSSTFDDLSDDIGQPLLLSGADSLNFPIEQSILNLSDANELSSGSYTSTSIPHLEPTLLPHKLLSDENCASTNNVWLPAQKDDSSSSNFIASGFSDEPNFFVDTKKVSENINFSNHNLLTEMSYPGEKQLYLNEASTNSAEITISGSLSTALLPSEQLLLETSKDYLRSCELLEEFESSNQHELLDSTSLEPTNVMDIGLPLLSNSSVVSSLVDNTTPHSKISPLDPLMTEQIDQNCHSYENDSNVLQEDCSVFRSSLEMECTGQEQIGNASPCNSSRPPCSLLECVCQSLDKSCSFHTVTATTEEEHSHQNNDDLVQRCDAAATCPDVQPVEQCEPISQEPSFIKESQNNGVETKEMDAKDISSTGSNKKLKLDYSPDLTFDQIDQRTSTDSLNCDDPDVDCNFNSNISFNNRNKNYVPLKTTVKSCYMRSDSWDDEDILTAKETKVLGIQKCLTEEMKSQSHKSQFEVCSVASIMKEIGILDVMDKRPENLSSVDMEQDTESASAGSNPVLKTLNVWKSGDGSSDDLWSSAIDHDYQLVQKNTFGGVIEENSIAEQSSSSTHDLNVTEDAQSEIEQNTLSGCTDKSGVETLKADGFECKNMLPRHDTQRFINLDGMGDNSRSSGEPSLGDCDVSNSSNAFSECNYGNSVGMSAELFNDMSHPSNIMVELDGDSNQSNIIFIDHGNFVGEQEIILAGPDGDAVEKCTNSNEHEGFSAPEDNAIYLSNVGLEDGTSLQLPQNWSKQGSKGMLVQKASVELHEGRQKKRKEGHLHISKKSPQISDRPGHHCILSANSIASGSNNTLGEDKEFEGMSLPSVDLYDCVSVVYSAYEEESTTFSKLWNPDIRLSSELFPVEIDTNDADRDVLPQQRLYSKKRKGRKSEVGKLERAVATSQQKLLQEIPLLQSTEIRKSSLCGDEENVKSQVLLKSTQVSSSASRKSVKDEVDGTYKSNMPQKTIDNQNEEVIHQKAVKSQKKASQLSLSSTIPFDKKNSSTTFLDTGSSTHPVIYAVNGENTDLFMELEDPVPDSVKLPSTKTAKVRENLWEKRTPKLSCEHCDKKFAKFFDLRQHMRSHTGEKPFQCVVCGRSFTQKSNLTKHLRTHKIWSKSVSTLSKNAIQKVCHKKKGGTVTMTESVVFEEGEVEKNISNSVIVNEEVQSAVANDSPNGSSDFELQDGTDGWEIISEECIVDNSYICQFCGASFVTYFELKTHRKTHQDEKVFFCPRNNCQKTFPDLESFVKHVNEHGPEESSQPCKICGKTFSSLVEMTHHMEAHAASDMPLTKKYCAKCPKCKSTFLSQEALENHLRTVSHDLPCPECKRIFSCERSLRRHLRTHSTVHPFVCKECGKRFKTALYLNTHLAMHRDDKPFACSECPAKFARKDRLSRHLKIHSDGERCPFEAHLKCNRQFTRPDKLKAHVLSHTEHQSTNCSFCTRQIAKFSVNKRHYISSNQQFEDSPSDTLDLPVMAVSCDVSSAEINSNVTINAMCNTSLNFNGSITLGMRQDEQSVDINNLSCENVETNSLNFDHVYKNPSKNKKVPTIGIIVMPLSQCMPGSGQQ